MNLINLIYCLFLGIGGFIAVIYEILAYSSGLSIGKHFQRNGLMTIIGLIVILLAIILTAFINPWWTIFIVLISSWLFSQIIIRIFGSFADILNQTNIPKSIKMQNDIYEFWNGFNQLLTTLKNNKIPFFQLTTSLLHFLLDIGYDCVKPDLVVMKVAKKLNIVDKETGDKNFRKTVKFIQEYSVDR